MENTAFILPPKLAKKVAKIKEEMGYSDSGSVITKAIELLDMSLGRQIILKEKRSKQTLEISDLEDYKQTVSLD